MWNNKGCPCIDCPARHTACWSRCEAYKKFKAGVDRRREARQAEKEREEIYYSVRKQRDVF